MRVLTLVLLLCQLSPIPVRADALAPPRPGQGTNSDVAPRRTGRMPARIDVSPVGAAAAPTHLVITIPRDALRAVMATPGSAGQGVPFDDSQPVGPSDRLRHVMAAGFLALAVLAVPLVLLGRRRGRAAAAMALAVLAGVTLIAADIAAPRPQQERRSVPPVRPPGGAQTVEVVIVPGAGPVQVQLTYAARP